MEEKERTRGGNYDQRIQEERRNKERKGNAKMDNRSKKYANLRYIIIKINMNTYNKHKYKQI